MNIRIEYSQAWGKFKQRKVANPVNAPGYKTLSCLISIERAGCFQSEMQLKFPGLMEGNKGEYLCFETMTYEFGKYICEVSQTQKHMAEIYLHRVQAFNRI